MKKRLIIYFNYHPNGQADAACRFAVQQMAAVGQVFFVNNGPLQPESRQWAQGCCHTVLERENTGFDVGAYRDAVLQIGLDMLLHYDEVVLMNYTLAGPVGDVAAMFAAMDGCPELDFWGLTRHYAMRSHRFGGAKAMVPEHIQSHFVVVRSRMMADFFAYWQAAALPASYEDSVRLHETQFTAHFAALGYRWDTFVDTKDLASLFVNPIMACPKLLLADRGCPFFKRRSFFTPYADELRRTDGQAAAELYDYLKSETDYPVERKAITGEYLFQLGLFQAAKDMNADAHQSFGKSLEILRAVLEQYPDSLGAFILEESANALYQGADSIYMKDIDGIRKRFPNRLLEIEMIRRLKPHSLVKQIKKIQIENEYNIDFDLDSLVNEMEKQQKL